MRTACTLVVLLLLEALTPGLLVAQGNPPAAPLVLVAPDGRRPVPTTIIGNQELIALADLAALLQVAVREDPLAGGFTVTYRGRTVLISQDQAMASVSGRVVALPSAPVRSGNRWLVPIEVIPRAIAPIYESRLELRRASRLLLLGDVRVPRVTGRIDAAGPPTRATLEFAPAAPVTTTVDAGRILLQIEADALDLALPAAAGLIDAFRPGDQPNTIAVILSPRAETARAAPAGGDAVARMVIDVTAGAALETAAPPATAEPPALASGSPAGAPAVGAVVLDPGHGGEDAGVRGAGGTVEKQVTLAVARRLKTLIETRLGLRVVMTRDDDRVVTLDQRAAMANNAKADLFVSLHMNAASNPSVSGAEIFTLLNERGAQSVRDQPSAVTLPVLGGRVRTIDAIPWEFAQERHLADSETFAATVEEELRQRIPAGPRPLQQAPLRVLGSVNMPAVLVELGYLTNPEQARAAQSDDFQAAVAEALFESIVRMRALLEGRREG